MSDIHPNSEESLDGQRARGRTHHFRKAVLALLGASPTPLTDRQMLEALNERDVNNVRPEVTRLKQDGKIIEVDRIKCPRTGKMVRRTTLAPRA